MVMRFGTWNVRSLYRAGSLRTVAEEISKYELDLVGVQEVRWDGGGTEPAGEYTFLYGKENENKNYVQVFSYIRESYQQLRG
jgi:exonuclease III